MGTDILRFQLDKRVSYFSSSVFFSCLPVMFLCWKTCQMTKTPGMLYDLEGSHLFFIF